MAWGLVEPSSFGRFFPDGDYVGWREHLTAYYEQMSEEEKAANNGRATGYILNVAQKFTREIDVPRINNPTLTPLEDHELPKEFRAERPMAPLAALIMMTNGLLAIDQRLKDLIERLEPGKHLFWPIRIMTHKGDHYPEPYYGLVIGQFLDSFRPEESEERSWQKGPADDYYVSIPTKEYYGMLALSKKAIGDAHLWRERRLRSPEIYLSDTLQKEIKQAGLKVPSRYRLKEAV